MISCIQALDVVNKRVAQRYATQQLTTLSMYKFKKQIDYIHHAQRKEPCILASNDDESRLNITKTWNKSLLRMQLWMFNHHQTLWPSFQGIGQDT